MSNKLEEYSQGKAASLYPTSKPRDGTRGIVEISKADYQAGKEQDIYMLGFDAAISLDLPVKFTNWKDALIRALNRKRHLQIVIEKDQMFFIPRKTSGIGLANSTLYKHWIDNIYKPE